MSRGIETVLFSECTFLVKASVKRPLDMQCPDIANKIARTEVENFQEELGPESAPAQVNEETNAVQVQDGKDDNGHGADCHQNGIETMKEDGHAKPCMDNDRPFKRTKHHGEPHAMGSMGQQPYDSYKRLPQSRRGNHKKPRPADVQERPNKRAKGNCQWKG